MEEYIESTNTALELKLVRKRSDIDDPKAAFYPDVTYQVFGNMEKIFGYKDLVIKMYYAACSLKLYMNVSYSSIVDPSEFGVSADTIIDKFNIYIVPDFITNLDVFEKCLEDESSHKPFGILLNHFSIGNDDEKQVFEIYVIGGESSDLFKTYLDRIQTFVLWYIDTANLINLEDSKWTIFMMYELYKNENGETCYSPVGYITVYEYYAYPDKIRPRISQVLILPPFQRKGLGTILLKTLYKHYINNNDIVDITVESPNAAFQLIRDFVDVDNFYRLKTFNKEKLLNYDFQMMVEEFKKLHKITQGQIRRVIEIILLGNIDQYDNDEYDKYIQFVKTRLSRPLQKKPTKLMLAMPEEMEKLEKPDSVENLEEIDLEYKELEMVYFNVLKKIEYNRTK